MKKRKIGRIISEGILLSYLAIVVITKYREKVYIREELQKPEVIAVIEKALFLGRNPKPTVGSDGTRIP